MVFFKSALLTTLCLSSSAFASPTPPQDVAERAVRFSRIVAFGDNLSDNGNGSVAHGVAQPGQPKNNIYGFNTWTNGPVAVMYLTTRLGNKLNLLDYAYGHAKGGSLFGATIDNAYTKSTANAPSSKDQIANYTADTRPNNPPGTVANSLHFLWIGANDINLYHIKVASTNNTAFGDQFSTLLTSQVNTLINKGANYIVVPNLYPKQFAPARIYYAGNNQTNYNNLGNAISYANTKIASALAKWPKKVFVYDAYSKMVDIQTNPAKYGILHLVPEYCDGYSQAAWQDCVVNKHGNQWYWMQTLDPTTYIHQILADDMAAQIKAKWP